VEKKVLKKKLRSPCRAPNQTQGLDRKYTIVGKYRGKAATNKHIAKIAALQGKRIKKNPFI
jgi:hypothetical protein